MGKKSLLKSTSKKKNTKTRTDSNKEVTPAGETSDATAAPKKAAGSKKQGAEKAAPPKSEPAEAKEVKAEAEVKKEKPLSIKELVLKKFDTEKPATLFAVKADDSARESVDAPPFVSGLDPAETERVRKLLFKTFDLSVPDPAPEVVAAAEPVMEKAPEPIIAAVEEKAPEPEEKAAAAEPEIKAPQPAIETPKPPPRPLPIGLDFPEPPPVPAMPVPNANRPAAPTAPCEPKKSVLHFLEGLDPMIKKAIGAGCGLAAIFLLISIVSISNMSKYYLINKGDTVEVWQGRFAPLGKDRIAILTGAPVKKETTSALSRAEVVPLIIEDFVSRADELMVSPGAPDFEKIRTLLTDALAYARQKESRERIFKRLDMIDMTALVFKASASAGKESRSDLEDARDYLTKAALLAKETTEKEIIRQKLKVINDKLIVPAAVEKAAPSKPAPPVTR